MRYPFLLCPSSLLELEIAREVASLTNGVSASTTMSIFSVHLM